jgi:hypothetical protein
MVWLRRQDWIPDQVGDDGFGMGASTNSTPDRLFREKIAPCFHTATNGLSFNEEW